MKREEISYLAHVRHPIAAPLSDGSVRELLERALPITATSPDVGPDGARTPGSPRVLDLACGRAEWLLRALSLRPDVRAEGVDTAEPGLGYAREAAERLGVGDRLLLHRQDAALFTGPHLFDLVLCVGSGHAFGGLLPALAAARRHLAPGGLVLIGEGYWEREPSPAATDLLGELHDLAATTEQVVSDGWAPVAAHTSSRAELDAYEWSWTGSLADWALDHPEHPDAPALLDTAAEHRRDWLGTYRESFGFVTYLLRALPRRD
ncbi:class I SAM-dependent methyltransferase [Streptomyces sp. NPDC097619]|uniref:SAM-dependent methyltransferase n=1 Tax=Streptomyces sp. NPDC097619 TaxID=3157228 RepID=UPI00333459DB